MRASVVLLAALAGFGLSSPLMVNILEERQSNRPGPATPGKAGANGRLSKGSPNSPVGAGKPNQAGGAGKAGGGDKAGSAGKQLPPCNDRFIGDVRGENCQ
ncbi:hypothetical protein HIM_05652 [Hirsutella minnesotensis 3608]|uniref:Uncharacterized protein n=1 Tax=Hirsutella minnesotensis 3608 TaxID=1043627 RepID=A0A0F7ZK26_9HYPO|nr:hypothetical protein HIM_05652 [Hirsutella minnesotensis 3608]